MVNLSARYVEWVFTMRNKKERGPGRVLEEPSAPHRKRGMMLLVEEKVSPNGQSRAEIYMRSDGLFEGRIYRLESQTKSLRHDSDFEVCGVTETLPRAQTIVYEELGL
jgi:hypothetical protein